MEDVKKENAKARDMFEESEKQREGLQMHLKEADI